MKSLIFVYLIFFFLSYPFEAHSQESVYYYYKGNKQPLQLNTEFIYLVTSPEISDSTTLNLLLGNNIRVSKFSEDNTSKTLMAGPQMKTEPLYWAEIQVQSKLTEKEYLSYLDKLKENRSIKTVSPFFRSNEESKIGLSQYFFVKLKAENDIFLLEKMGKETNTEIVGQNKFMPLWYTMKCTEKSPDNALQNANKFYESQLFDYAEPDLMVDDLLNTANDPQYIDQWGLDNTGLYGGTTGMDINAVDAWQITKGSRGIIVAVLDHGFEMGHPDLQENTFGTGFDTESGSSPAQVLGSHGTACAGIIGAIQDNNQGISGVAPGIRLMSVSNSLVLSPSVRQNLANGINWAWQNGAHIISNSWGHNDLVSSLIDDAISNALTHGRGGLGTLVVFASGNANGAVSYPANSNPDIIAVGAMSPCGERKSPGSCDGELWGSNFGPQLDIVAPGVLISTTDRQGSSGYNSGMNLHGNSGGSLITADYSDRNYTVWFNGTSSATPMVAGVAALILSVNPCLTHDEVENIIEQSAQKVGAYTYSLTAGRVNGTWNNEMGYGLLDAEAAVQMAQGMLPTSSGFDLFSKDRPFDTGIEANPDTGPMFITEDIWVRQNLDGGLIHENPEYNPNTPNGVYVKVTNRGRQPSTCSNLSLYFTKASTGLVWPTHWENYFQTTSAGNILHGEKINTVFIPALAPGASYTAEIPWYPPNPADFDNDIQHFCLLSRILSPSDPMFDEQNLVGVGGNVRRNNNIVWKNLSVVDNEPDADASSIFVRGVQQGWSLINLGFLDNGFREKVRVPFFKRGGKLVIKTDPQFIRRILEAKSAPGIKIIGNSTFLVTSPYAQINNLSIHHKETFSMSLKFSVKLNEKEETFLDVVQKNSKTNEIEGGERFIIKQKEKPILSPDQPTVEKAKIIVYPNPVKSELYIKYKVEMDNSNIELSLHNMVTMQKTILFFGKRNRGEYHDKINIHNIKEGMYVLTLRMGDQVISERVLIK